MLADSIRQLLYVGKPQENRSALATIAWIIIIVALGMIAYLFINEGSWEGVLKRVKEFVDR